MDHGGFASHCTLSQPVEGEAKTGWPIGLQPPSEKGALVGTMAQVRPPLSVRSRGPGAKPRRPPVAWAVSQPWSWSTKSSHMVQFPGSVKCASSWTAIVDPCFHVAPPAPVLKTTKWSAHAEADPTASATQAWVTSRKYSP